MTYAEQLMHASHEYAREAEAWRVLRKSGLAREALRLHIEVRAFARGVAKRAKAVKP